MNPTTVAPRSIGAVLDGAIRLWLQSQRPLLLAFVVFGIIGLLPYVAVSLFEGSWTYGVRHLDAAFYLFETVALISYFLHAWWALGLYRWYDARMHGDSMAIAAALRGAASALLPRLRLALVYGCVAFFIALIFGGVYGFLASADGAHTVTYMLCVLAPGLLAFIYFFLRSALAAARVGLGEKSAFSAIEDSWRLTRGHFWRASAVVLLLYAFNLILMLTLAVLAASYDFSLGKSRALIQPQVTMLMSMLGPWMGSLITAGSYTLLGDLKARHQGDDLLLKVEHLAGA